MDAAAAMGCFLRVWRREWAGLSREQVALAVTGLGHGTPRITRHAVQAWEEGQPPHSAAELDALLALMRRHGLTEGEGEDFRRTVFAACLSRQYPELFAHEDFAYRDDIEQTAEGLRWRAYRDGAAGGIVGLVAYARELEAALANPGRLVPGPQLKRQRAALAWLWSAVAYRHYDGGRAELAARLAAANAEHLARHFGAHGISSWLTPFTEEFLRAMAMHGSTQDRRVRLVWVQRQLDLYRESAAGGDERTALRALRDAVSDTWVLPTEGAAHLLQVADSLAERFHELSGDQGPLWSDARFYASIRLDLPDRAAAYLADLERLKQLPDNASPYETRSPLYRAWLYGAGDLAKHCGDYRAAFDYYMEALDLDRAAGSVPGVQRATLNLERCEDAASRERTISLPK
jgi:hypothetical protein